MTTDHAAETAAAADDDDDDDDAVVVDDGNCTASRTASPLPSSRAAQLCRRNPDIHTAFLAKLNKFAKLRKYNHHYQYTRGSSLLQ